MSREAAENEEKRINNTLTGWTVEKFLDMRKELLDRQKDLEKSNMEMVEKVEKLSNELQEKMDKIVEALHPEGLSEVVEKIRFCDDKIEKLSKELQLRLNQIDETLKTEVSSEIVEKIRLSDEKIENLSKKQQEKFHSIQSKLNKNFETLKPETISGIEQKIRLSDEKIEKLLNGLQSKMDKIIETHKPEASSKIEEKIRLCDEKIEKQLKKFDPILSKLNEIDKTLKPEVSSKIEKLSMDHQEKFDSIQSKLDKIEKTLKPEVWSEIVEKIKLSDEKIEKLRKEQHEKFVRFDTRTELLNKQKDIEKSNYEIVEKIKLSDEKMGNLSKDHREKLDSIQLKMNKIENTLKPEISLEIEKLWKEHEEKFDSIQSKLTEIEKALKPEVWSEIVEKIKLSDAKIENLTKYHREKLDSIQLKMNEIDRTLKPKVSSEIEKLSKEHQENFDSIQSKLDKVVETLKPEVSSEIEENNDPETSGKYFVLKHTFNNVSSFKDKEIRYSEEEEHFGVPWRISVARCDGFLGLYLLNSLLQNTEKKREIEVEDELKVMSPSSREKKEESKGKSCVVFKSDGIHHAWGRNKFIEWDKLEKDFVVDDSFCAEIAVKVKKMTGIYKENLRRFDKTMEEYSNVVLIVNDEKFYVLKLYLATDSPYFKTLFMEKSNETEKTEIKLSGIDADDFQNYLEVLYEEQAIDEFTVEGILMVAYKYDTNLVIFKCENFLRNVSKKTLKKKLQLSIRYNLPALMKQCIEEIK